MDRFLADFWWVPLFTVPALAIAIKLAAEKASWVDTLPAPLRKQLSRFEHSFPGHWVVTATMRDGRRFSRVVIDERFRLPSDTALPLKLGDIRELAWEGFVEAPPGPIRKLSEGRRDVA